MIPAGFAALVVVAQFATSTDATAELALPLAAVLAAAGVAAGWARIRDFDRWAGGCAAVTFAVYAAPVLASGTLGFAGYLKLDDTATWLALTDRVIEHGRSLEGLPPSSYEAVLRFNLADGYPVGALLPFGLASLVVGEDVAWTFQPYMAALAAILALLLYSLAGQVLRSRGWRAAVAAIGSQAALLYGYVLWGGVKEIAAAVLIALAAALVLDAIGERGPRAVLPLAVALAAAASVLSPAGAIVWTGPILVGALALTVAERPRWWPALRQSIWATGVTVALTVPWLLGAGLVPPTSSPLTSETAQGNLDGPLSPLQAAGIWPATDFRLDPDARPFTYALIGLTLASAACGLVLAWRRRSALPALLAAAVAVAATATFLVGSPWVEAKGFAIASPVILFFALTTLAAASEAGLRLGAVGVVAIAAAVVWSNALAYRGANLAPADRLAELERIGDTLAGAGPTMTPEYEPYAVRHFLRVGDPEGASELRRRTIPLRDGDVVPKGSSADLDELAIEAEREGVLLYRTLVVRRSPVASRPPAPYRLAFEGDHYEVWRRPLTLRRQVVEHLPLGDRFSATARPACSEVRRLARVAGDGGLLAAAGGREATVVSLAGTPAPAGWTAKPSERAVLPDRSGVVRVEVAVAEAGAYEVWLGGTTRDRVELEVDGEPIGSRRHYLSHPGHYMSFGEVELSPGTHAIEVRHDETTIAPGGALSRLPLGPLALAPAGAPAGIELVDPDDAAELCARPLDWIEALGPR